ncbi:MAG: kynureninase [Bacteroidetes bacterium]|mgnify:CR=1 FL=1|nr:MAG: kynureninase [Bacteroidota bacterium]REK05021.1 MAG: kynureninase [Bacteroidota bacterium]REK36476.1 MAG: kynureninase [Bacteroidota bacterium]
MKGFENTLEFAWEMDDQDSLAGFREKFYFPQMDGRDVIYMTGNSLGLQPKSTQDYVLRELEDWASWGVEGHFHARMPWFEYQDFLTVQIADLLGAQNDEVVAMNSLTTNLHLLMVSFYRPDKKRYKIICEYDLFPSDLYAVQSQAAFHGFNPDDAVVFLKPRKGEHVLRTEDIIAKIEEHGSSLATVMLGAVNYYTGQFFEIDAIGKAVHKAGATYGLNLAHAAGNVPLRLHDWNVDYACFCSYKYLNSGPGGVSGIFVHEKHKNNPALPRFAGWWGNDPDTRFQMPRKFVPAEGARGWQLSNAPVLSMSALKASLDIFEEAGMNRLAAKSQKLTAYLEFIIRSINESRMNAGLDEPVEIISPADSGQRGCQLSMIIRKNGKSVYENMVKKGVIVDWREPDVMRAAPVPLYNSFEDVFTFGMHLEQSLQ